MVRQQKIRTKTQELVTVAFPENIHKAKEYVEMLKSSDIPASLREPEESDFGESCIAVMVPEEYLDEAHMVIESMDAYDDFYDMGMDDDFDPGIFEEDF